MEVAEQHHVVPAGGELAGVDLGDPVLRRLPLRAASPGRPGRVRLGRDEASERPVERPVVEGGAHHAGETYVTAGTGR